MWQCQIHVVHDHCRCNRERAASTRCWSAAQQMHLSTQAMHMTVSALSQTALHMGGLYAAARYLCKMPSPKHLLTSSSGTTSVKLQGQRLFLWAELDLSSFLS